MPLPTSPWMASWKGWSPLRMRPRPEAAVGGAAAAKASDRAWCEWDIRQGFSPRYTRFVSQCDLGSFSAKNVPMKKTICGQALSACPSRVMFWLKRIPLWGGGWEAKGSKDTPSGRASYIESRNCLWSVVIVVAFPLSPLPHGKRLVLEDKCSL